MPLNPDDVAEAQRLQQLAAHDTSPVTRLVAGPGTGKSSSIEERFRWLIEDEGVNPAAIFGVSFTRAAATDLRLRVREYLSKSGVSVGIGTLRISTLHSLALGLLARANLLSTFPVSPRVLDEWEVANVFDGEFRVATRMGKRRAEDVRRAHEAFWNTGERLPAGYMAPNPPISDQERTAFLGFHRSTTQTYAAVLPGEIVRLCVQHIEAGLLEPREVAGIAHLIVDEYQDLNPLDIQLIDRLSRAGVFVFVAGDDDQSIYSFRFASPRGIQDFTDRHPSAGDHVLEGCFRCASEIVEAADYLIENFSPVQRIPKELESLWRTATPPAEGIVLRWKTNTGDSEAALISGSIRQLLDAGMPANRIMVLLSNKRLFPPIRAELDNCAIAYVPPKEDSWAGMDSGRFLLGALRIVIDADDYVALRLILGCRRGVGVATCASIAEKVATRLLNYRSVFYRALPEGVFASREQRALEAAQDVCESLLDFRADDTLASRAAVLRSLLVTARGDEEAAGWDETVEFLPPETSLLEVRDYLAADNSEQQETVVKAVFERLGRVVPDALPVPRVRVMTMHGAKGLQADVVFIPALEEPLLPGPRRAGTPGLVLEGARLLYVSMTRARTALVVTLAYRRYWQGQSLTPPPSQYAAYLGGPFVRRDDTLTEDEAKEIVALAAAMVT